MKPFMLLFHHPQLVQSRFGLPKGHMLVTRNVHALPCVAATRQPPLPAAALGYVATAFGALSLVI
eukprot:363973-Chlamydomonas_euryale.AAC.19